MNCEPAQIAARSSSVAAGSLSSQAKLRSTIQGLGMSARRAVWLEGALRRHTLAQNLLRALCEALAHLPARVIGWWFHLYLILDLYSRKVMAARCTTATTRACRSVSARHGAD